MRKFLTGHILSIGFTSQFIFGAGDEIRTRDSLLGSFDVSSSGFISQPSPLQYRHTFNYTSPLQGGYYAS